MRYIYHRDYEEVKSKARSKPRDVRRREADLCVRYEVSETLTKELLWRDRQLSSGGFSEAGPFLTSGEVSPQSLMTSTRRAVCC